LLTCENAFTLGLTNSHPSFKHAGKSCINTLQLYTDNLVKTALMIRYQMIKMHNLHP